MAALLLLLLLLVSPPARAGCEGVDGALLEGHVGLAMGAWRAGDDGRFEQAHTLLIEDLGCLAGSGLRARSTDLFLVLARGALAAGDDERALAALRALLVLQGDYLPDQALVPLDTPLAPLFALAQVLGPEAAGFKALYLGQAPVPAPLPIPLDPERLAAQQRAELLAQVREEIETDRKAHHAGAVTATVGGLTCGLSLAFLAARNTSGAHKVEVAPRPQRETMGKVWTGTAIGGAATMGLGLWLMHVSQLEAGAGLPTIGWGARF